MGGSLEFGVVGAGSVGRVEERGGLEGIEFRGFFFISLEGGVFFFGV